MAVKLSPFGNSQFVNEQGAPASGWLLNCYVAGSINTPLLAYTDATGGVAQSNPIVINTLGFPTLGQVWLLSGQAYKFVLTDALGVVKKTVDNISGVNDTGATTDEWADTGATPTYVSPSSYTLVGDQTTQFHMGRRQKFLTTAGTVYGRILTSAYTTLTTVTMQMDGTQALDNGLSSVQNSILRANVLSLPERIATTTGAVNVYVASVGISRLAIGDEYKIKIAIANDGALAPTLALDGNAAIGILTQNGSVPAPGVLNGAHKFRYDGTNFIVLNPIPRGGGLLNTIYYSVVAQSVTVSIGSPAVITYASMDKLPLPNAPIVFATTGTLPTGIVAGVTYYVKPFNSTTSNISATPGGAAIITSGSQSGTQSVANPAYLKAINNPSFVITEVWGGGGGGGGMSAASAPPGAAGGGGAGGYSRQKILSAALLATEVITIGAGGTAGANTGTGGGTGGTTSFGSHSSATGGTGGVGGATGQQSLSGGAGGSGTGGDLNLFGNTGGFGMSIAVGNSVSGCGGTTTLGGNGISLGNGIQNSGTAGQAASGSGASGALTNGSAQAGGIGGSGFCIVYEYS